MEHEKYSYVESLRWLANRYNIELEETETSPEFKAIQLTSDSLFIINNFAKDFFRNALKFTEEQPIRHFYRINIDHLTEEEWNLHKQ